MLSLCLGASAAGSSPLPFAASSRGTPLFGAIKPRLTGFWKRLIFIVAFHFRHFPNPRLAVSPSRPQRKALSCLGWAQHQPGMGATAAAPHTIFRSNIFLRKRLKDSWRRLFLSDPCCHIGYSWSGHPQRVGLHPVSAGWVTESSASISKLNLRDRFHSEGKSYSSVREPVVTSRTEFSAQFSAGLPDRPTFWDTPSPSRPAFIQTRLERGCEAVMSNRWADVFKNRPQRHSWVWMVGFFGKRCLLSLSEPGFDSVALNKWV